MLSVISIGIGEYNNMENIPCAKKDCEKIYTAFKHIMGSDFADYTSICLVDLNASDFIRILECLRFSLTSEDNTLVVFFSGHAKTMKTYGSSTDFILCFSDYYEKRMQGEVSLQHQLLPILNKIPGEIILILDCCFSGASLSFASETYAGQRISVLSSAPELGLSEFDNDGSKFSKSLYESILEIEAENTEFKLNNLQNKINEKYPRGCFNMGAGHRGDIILKHNIDLGEIYIDFHKRFMKQILQSDAFSREALWYSLCDMPFCLTEKIYTEFFRCFNSETVYPLESSWLVRRAIGSSISCIRNNFNRKKITRPLLNSMYWQEQCIGLIGSRYDMANEEDEYEFVIKQIKNRNITKIDAVWIANLYAADNPKYDYKIFIGTSLCNDSWGIQEIFKTARQHSVSVDDFINSMETNLKPFKAWKELFCAENRWTSNLLYDILSSKQDRGRLPMNSKSKFILSVLYGNWRGHKLVNFKSYFETQNKQLICKELFEASKFPEAEYRMAIFEFLITEPELTVEYLDQLMWGLSDTHPWVRRTAIQSFKAAYKNEKECNLSILSYLDGKAEQIGELDLILEYSEKNINNNSLIITKIQESGKFSKSEIESLSLSLFNKS